MSKSTALAKATTAALVDWNNEKMLTQIKETYGKNLLPAEWNLFMGLGKATGLNPFLREIWAVKYGNNPASVFVGRDGYRRSAQAHPEYEYHYSDAVYANDTFENDRGEILHKYNLKDRGALVGAYCIVKRKSASIPVVTFVPLSEYKQNFGVWTTKPATMIKKVAEAQGLRASFQELFAGTYEESEEWEQRKDQNVRIVDASPEQREEVREDLKPLPGQTFIQEDGKPGTVQEDAPTAPAAPEAPKRRGRRPKATVPVVDAEVVEPPKPQGNETFKNIFNKDKQPEETKVPEDEIPPGKIRVDQTKKLFAVWGEYRKVKPMDEAASTAERRNLMKSMFNVESSVSLNERQADELIERIQALTDMAGDYERGESAARAAGDSF